MPAHSNPANTVLITGASSGIGLACALHMDRLGWQVFAGVRKKADADALRHLASPHLTPVYLDVAKPAQIRKAVQIIAGATGGAGLSGLVNNAGIPYGGPIEFLDLSEIRAAFEVNFFGVIAVTQAFLPLLRQAHGRIVNISSISGLVASPFLSPYSTTKFALEALSDALRVELSPWRIRVAVVEPGAINTPIWAKSVTVAQSIIDGAPPAGAKLYGKVLGAFQDSLRPHGISTDVAARAVAHALTSRYPHARYRLGIDGLAVGVLRFLPEGARDWFFRSRLPKWG